MNRRCASVPPSGGGPRRHGGRMTAFLLLASVVLFQFPAFLRAQAPAPATAKVAAVKVTGSKRFSEDDIARAIGLAPGTQVTREQIQAGANRLSQLGWFNRVDYRFQTTSATKGVEIQFTVSDAPCAPVWFDNFPWFTDAELAGAIRAAGLYDGTAPESGAALDSMREAIAGLMKSRNIAGEVEGEMIQAPESEGMIERFRVTGSEVRVASLELSDPMARDDKRIAQVLDSVVGKPYSRYTLAVFLFEQVRPAYTARGYLRVRFGEPITLFAGEPTKPLSSEVTVRVPIEPGVLYHWGGAAWSGQVALDSAALDALLSFKRDEPADALRLQAGWDRIGNEYGKRGYIEAKIEPTPQYDDAAERVSYAVRITEGTQYRMGQLVLTGLSLNAERQLLSNWKIARGDVFDNAYYEDFVNGGARNVFRDTPVHFLRVGHLLRPNLQTKTVDVLLDFQ
jgi:outer membrane protein assembly factor BamA